MKKILIAHRVLLLMFSCVCLLVNYANAQDDQGSQKPILSDQQIADFGYAKSTTSSKQIPGYRPLERVIVTYASPKMLQQLKSVAPGVKFFAHAGFNSKRLPKQSIDAIFTVCSENPQLQIPENVAWVHSYSAGVEGCANHAAVKGRELLMSNSRGAAAAPIAEHAIAMMMSYYRGLHLYRDNQRNKKWQALNDQDNFRGRQLDGQTLLVLGLGTIGKQVAKRAKALGMKVTATRRSSREGPSYVDYVGLSDETLKLASQADVIVNVLPLTQSTKGFLDETFFQAMKSDALLVSVGRGGTVVTDDLVTALQKGALGGAALDVTDPEPLPKSSPLWSMPNVMITPHVAGVSDQSLQRTMLLLFENLRRYQAGEPLLNNVDIEAGY